MPTNIVVNYSTSSTATIPIAAGTTYDKMIANIAKAGGFYLPGNAIVWIPYGQITSITAS